MSARHSSLMLFAALLMPLTGCLRIVADPSPYYAKGPDQVEPPDGFLKEGEQVYVVSVWNNYARFFNDDGVSGTVWWPSLMSPSQYDELKADRKPYKLKDDDAPTVSGEGLAQ